MVPTTVRLGLALIVGLVIVTETLAEKKMAAVGEHCAPAAAPVNGTWQVVGEGKDCPEGTSCRRGACNCDDLADGTVMGISRDDKNVRSCKRVAKQKCAKSDACFHDVDCLEGVCTCKPDANPCVDKKNDVTILAG